MKWPVQDRDRTLFQRRAHVRDYLEGLHWNLNYYHNGCASWDWYFPHLYSPLATDMVNLKEFYDEFEGQEDAEFKTFPFADSTPFPSLAQLLSVLPPQSAELLPNALSELMLNPSSPLIEYYPPDFTSDPNGKRQPWEAVVQIPFIDADMLLDTVQRILVKDEADKALLSPAERRRNVRGKSHIFTAPGGGDDINGKKTNGATRRGQLPKGSRKKKATVGASRGAPKKKKASTKGSKKKKAATKGQ